MADHKKIRPAVAADVSDLKRIIGDNDLFPPPLLDPMIAGFLDRTADREFWLVHDGNGVDAVAFCRPEEMTEGTWNLLLLAVDPARHGQGIGAIILQSVERHLTELDQRILLVETSGTDDFADTRRFYGKCGYHEEGRIRDYYTQGDDKIIFRKCLAT